MVAANDQRGERADEVADLVGAGPVADDVAEIPELIVLSVGGGKNGLERLKVCMDVG